MYASHVPAPPSTEPCKRVLHVRQGQERRDARVKAKAEDNTAHNCSSGACLNVQPTVKRDASHHIQRHHIATQHTSLHRIISPEITSSQIPYHLIRPICVSPHQTPTLYNHTTSDFIPKRHPADHTTLNHITLHSISPDHSTPHQTTYYLMNLPPPPDHTIYNHTTSSLIIAYHNLTKRHYIFILIS